jgi:hypothetical protein
VKTKRGKQELHFQGMSGGGQDQGNGGSGGELIRSSTSSQQVNKNKRKEARMAFQYSLRALNRALACR